jgi:hypothetical protein
MKIHRLTQLAVAAATIGLAACEDLSPSRELTNDAILDADLASSSGDAIASVIEVIIANESVAGLSNATADVPNADINSTLTFNRSRTCYDANNAVVSGCTPLSSVRKIVTHVTMDGSRSSEGAHGSWSGVVHRVLDDTVTRNYSTAQPPVEQSRTHSSVGTGDDTTTFVGERVTRIMSETTRDSVNAVTWNLPRANNPFPVSGSIVRVVNVKVTASSDTRTETRDLTRRVQVSFPADAQGNVVLTINAKTCNLNLVTHVVSGCH